MGIIKDIIKDFEKLIKTKITIPLENGDVINFEFQPQDLPHLLGLQYLVDHPVLFEYSQARLSATALYKGICNGDIDSNEIEKSNYFKEVYQNRIKYFSSAMILDIISTRQIVKFDPNKIKVFTTKLDKLDYMFWKLIKEENNTYGYLGIGFMTTGKKSDINYPNTFFFRPDSQYICNQHPVTPMSLMITNKMKKVTLEIYWDAIRASMIKNPHYKYLMSVSDSICDKPGNFNYKKILGCKNNEIIKHYELLRADELNKARSSDTFVLSFLLLPIVSFLRVICHSHYNKNGAQDNSIYGTHQQDSKPAFSLIQNCPFCI